MATGDTPTTARQRKAQNLIMAIMESDDTAEVKRDELWRIAVFARKMRGQVTEAAEELEGFSERET